jgi:hypothetical protein
MPSRSIRWRQIEKSADFDNEFHPTANALRTASGQKLTALRPLMNRQANRRLQPRPIIIEMQRAIMQLRDRRHQRQPQPGAGGTARGLAPIETLGRAGAVCRQYSGPAIGDGDVHHAVIDLRGERDRRPTG